MIKYLSITVPAIVAISLYFFLDREKSNPSRVQRIESQYGFSSPVSPPSSSLHRELRGNAQVVDADTVEIRGQRVRLFGVDAPERSQTCERLGERWPCGLEAAAALTRLVAGHELRCDIRDRDRNQRLIAVCWLRELDLGRWLVGEGWAVAYRRFSREYVEVEETARRARRGIWTGPFMLPEDYRQGRR